MSGNVFFTSDTHFSHRMVAQLRGFDTTEQHDREIVSRWNYVVSPKDQVWHLGDVGMGNFATLRPWLEMLNGTIHLITGNHDTVWPGNRDAYKHQREWLEIFETVQAFARRKVAGTGVLLSHFPFTGDHTDTPRHMTYRLQDPGGVVLLHGHTHSSQRVAGRQIHVGVDAWGLTPVPIDVLSDLVRAQSPQVPS